MEKPVGALHDGVPGLRARADRPPAGRPAIWALQLQWEYLEHAKEYVEHEDDTAANAEVLERWERVLSALETEPLTLHRELDWVAKYRLLAAYRERDGLAWKDPKLRRSTSSTTTSARNGGCTTGWWPPAARWSG